MDKDEVIRTVKSEDERLRGLELAQRHGGACLGVMRSWIQSHATNGDNVDWGSDEFLRMGPLTVRELEYLAGRIAAATLEEYKCNLVNDDERRALDKYRDRENWRTVREDDNDGNAKVFDPGDNRHFAQPPVKHGWEMAEFDSNNWRNFWK